MPDQPPATSRAAATGSDSEPSNEEPCSSVPQKAKDTLKQIDATGEAPPGYKGGAKFDNDGRAGGQVLPTRDAKSNPVSYREWDVDPKPPPGTKRNAERLVTGSDGSAYYTNNHYLTFTKIR